MFYNPFEKKSKNIKKNIPKIIADIHEKDSEIFAEIKFSNLADLEITNLKIGDYLIGDIIIERKTISDFANSIISGRLKEQLFQMSQYEEKILIIEGNIEELHSKINKKAIKGSILSIISKNKIPIIQTKNSKETAEYLIILSRQKINNRNSIKHQRIPKTIDEQKMHILESFPNIGPKKAEELIKEFLTLEKIFNANENELSKVLKNKSKKFKKILES